MYERLRWGNVISLWKTRGTAFRLSFVPCPTVPEKKSGRAGWNRRPYGHEGTHSLPASVSACFVKDRFCGDEYNICFRLGQYCCLLADKKSGRFSLPLFHSLCSTGVLRDPNWVGAVDGPAAVVFLKDDELARAAEAAAGVGDVDEGFGVVVVEADA